MANPQGIPIEPGDTIASVFAKRVAATPDAIAYREFDAASNAWVQTTWRQAADAVVRRREALARERLGPGERVAIMSRNGREWVYFDMAALAEGLVVVPLYVDDRAESIAYILNDSGARVVLVEGPEQLAKLAEVATRIPNVQRIVSVKALAPPQDPRAFSMSDWLQGAAVRRAPIETSGHALATIVYTSGTTGKPKGVMLSHQNMLQNVKAGLGAYEVFPEDVFLSFLPLSHMLERTVGYYLTRAAGSKVAFARSIAQLGDDFKAVNPTIIVSVPRIFERLHAAIHGALADASPTKRRLFEAAHRMGWEMFLWKQGRGGWKPSFLAWPLLRTLVAKKLLERLGGRLRLAISGGAALNPQIAHTFIGLGLPICQGYGLTEASPVVSVNRLDHNEPASIGTPLPGVEIAFGDNEVLKVRGPSVMLGYWKNPEATARVKDAEGWLDTGDQARMRDGFLYITGRIKEIIVLGNGEKVPPVDMELAAQLDPLLEQVMIVGEGMPYLAALVVLDPAEAKKVGAVDDKAVAARITAQLKDFPGYAQVRRAAIVREAWTVDNGMLTPTLKLKRTVILEKHKGEMEALYKGHKK